MVLTMLSICVPTYNRISYLEQLMNTLLPEAQNYNVEVCVSDNNSSDYTGKYLWEKAKNFSCLKFQVNEENCGLDMNMLKVMKMATGEYILIIGDDDGFTEGGLSLILKSLENNPDLLILDGWETDRNLNPTGRHWTPQLRGQKFSSPVAACPYLIFGMRLGTFVIKKSCLNLSFGERYLETGHAYQGAVWDSLAKQYRKAGQCQIECMELPTILFRNAEKSWDEIRVSIYLYGIPELLRRLPEDYYEEVMPILQNYMKTRSTFSWFIYFRATNQLNPQIVNQYMSLYPDTSQKKALLVCIVPVFLAKMLLFLKTWIKNLIQVAKSATNKLKFYEFHERK
jgi:glycosyltransferase involved in cell wall biosynthesis